MKKISEREAKKLCLNIETKEIIIFVLYDFNSGNYSSETTHAQIVFALNKTKQTKSITIKLLL